MEGLVAWLGRIKALAIRHQCRAKLLPRHDGQPQPAGDVLEGFGLSPNKALIRGGSFSRSRRSAKPCINGRP